MCLNGREGIEEGFKLKSSFLEKKIDLVGSNCVEGDIAHLLVL